MRRFFHPIVSITAVKILQQQTVVQNLTQTRKSHQKVVIHFVIKGCLVAQKLVIFHSPSRVISITKNPAKPCVGSASPWILGDRVLASHFCWILWGPFRLSRWSLCGCPGGAHQGTNSFGVPNSMNCFLGKIYMETIDCPIKF